MKTSQKHLAAHPASRPQIILRERINPTTAQESPIDPSLWLHPMLRLYADEARVDAERQLALRENEKPHSHRRLSLVPTLESAVDGEPLAEDEIPVVSPESELPHLQDWTAQFVLALLEIWCGRRSSAQMARWSHRRVHHQIQQRPALITQSPKIRKIYISQPDESIAEITVTLRIGERIRALMLRFEGVDRRWICTELVLL